MSKPMVEQALLDEAVRMGSQSAHRANQFALVSKLLIDAVEQALLYLDTGRTTQARDRLKKAAAAAGRMLE